MVLFLIPYATRKTKLTEILKLSNVSKKGREKKNLGVVAIKPFVKEKGMISVRDRENIISRFQYSFFPFYIFNECILCEMFEALVRQKAGNY